MNTSEIVPVVELRNAGKIYSAKGRGAAGVAGISLRVARGEIVLLIGPSGSGKTTLLTLMAGLVAPTEGEVLFSGEALDQMSPHALQKLRAEKVGVVFQSFNLIDALTVSENVSLVGRFAGAGSKEADVRAATILEELGIGHLAWQFPWQLSQGEKQRVAIARACANRPLLLLADEPTASLDTRTGRDMIEVLRAYARYQSAAVVVATHDLRLVEYAERVVHLNDGRIVSVERNQALYVRDTRVPRASVALRH